MPFRIASSLDGTHAQQQYRGTCLHDSLWGGFRFIIDVQAYPKLGAGKSKRIEGRLIVSCEFNDAKNRHDLEHICHHHPNSLLITWLLACLALTIERLYRLRYLRRGTHPPRADADFVHLLWLSLSRRAPADTSRLTNFAAAATLPLSLLLQSRSSAKARTWSGFKLVSVVHQSTVYSGRREAGVVMASRVQMDFKFPSTRLPGTLPQNLRSANLV
jgi:hypothetical protein